MKRPGVDMIVDALPPPGKMRPPKPGGAAEDAADGGADDAQEADYDPAADSAVAVAKAMGVPADKVDGSALADAFRDLLKNLG
ncbi:hypothetical protein [Mycobacterium sp.]|uniref:hypothetical protein n=1 Tax=Mycobacterium sp. TaxID=1785 RepID=UPI00261F8092|nr:hypothetical protein [Mycobacterium sp.]